ncbi:NAD(P)-binding domain-containing protein [Streptantibioticus silvisoli]|uniref:NAD(P)-binding domain-containing protein n=1 Tax=Streptantibioticus silvisoli TaxID=2705255 RepID=A0ABT6W4Q4_9ACTN|nr:NAD(P)-binding domain-containing protein [Streptantibioticus silvisoli]MDI5964937.1 NAD(P)-binding domain-containing protein [Streptantibioticus silvisoli]
MNRADATVLTTSDAATAIITDGLRASGASVASWITPADATARQSGLFARTASRSAGWGLATAARTVITLWPTPAHLDAMAPHLLPYLAPGATWLQLGPHPAESAAALAGRAAGRGVALVHAPVGRTPDGGLLLPDRHRTALLRRPLAPAVRLWITRIPPLAEEI